MEFRKLGKTGMEVSVLGLGTEYLRPQSRETVVTVIQKAIAQGVNYFDLVFAFPDYLDNLREAFHGKRDQIFLTGHLGSTVQNGQYKRIHHAKKCTPFFLDTLARLNTGYVDVLFLHNCNTQKDYDLIFKPDGLRDCALHFREQGKARAIGFSGHNIATALQAVETGQIDVLMFPLNIANHAVPGQQDLLNACVARNVGVVAMKPFAGGKLLNHERTIKMARYQMGGEPVKLKKSAPLSAVQCVAYVLAQRGVVTIVPGCANLEELTAVLAYQQAAETEKDFSASMADFKRYTVGECVYCNHCLPCPAQIDIGQTLRLLDMARQSLTPEVREAYTALSANASDCTQCGACMTRCPFDVDVIVRMAETRKIFV